MTKSKELKKALYVAAIIYVCENCVDQLEFGSGNTQKIEMQEKKEQSRLIHNPNTRIE